MLMSAHVIWSVVNYNREQSISVAKKESQPRCSLYIHSSVVTGRELGQMVQRQEDLVVDYNDSSVAAASKS